MSQQKDQYMSHRIGQAYITEKIQSLFHKKMVKCMSQEKYSVYVIGKGPNL